MVVLIFVLLLDLELEVLSAIKVGKDVVALPPNHI